MATGHDLSFAAPDWATPWFAPWRVAGEPVADAVLEGLPLWRALEKVQGRDCPVHFVAADALPADIPYELFVHQMREVPTRDNLHDFFNALVWLRYPRTKLALNALHAATLARDGVSPRRGALRDALTLIDENGMFLRGGPELLDALRGRDWQRLFVSGRAGWHGADVVLFGHALLEKLVSPRKDITAHVLPLPAASAGGQDSAMAALCDPAWLASKPFAPLPVLGIPGWDPANLDPAFYDDAKVFRPHAWRPQKGNR